MFVLRSATVTDLTDLYELSQLGTFISLPKNKDLLKKLIVNSEKSFLKPDPILYKNNYIFVLEDRDKNKVVGVSIIHAQHGTEYEPHFFLRVSQEHKYSKSINTGFVHGILKLGYETNGPTEIGGLVLQPELRNHAEKLGKQLSYVRFLYMSLFPERFKEEVHCELMPPFDEKGKSPLWEAIGRRFLNMDYHEADMLSRQNKEFILNLYPSNTIYVTLLPIEAKNAIGKVGPQTLPVKKMLETVGFKYIHEVDPFDGGPHYRCALKDILPIKEKEEVFINPNLSFKEDVKKKVLFTLNDPKFPFSAIASEVNLIENQPKNMVLSPSVMEAFDFNDNEQAHLIYL